MISLEKIKDFDTFTKIAQECWRFGQINSCPKSNKLPNLVTLPMMSCPLPMKS